MDNRKDVAHLYSRLVTYGASPQAVAAELGVTTDAILDMMRKHGIAMPTTGLAGSLTVRQCRDAAGSARQRVPYGCASYDPAEPMVVLGADGFVGHNLCTALVAAGINHIAFGRRHCDLMDRAGTVAALSAVRAGVVINLAAFVGGIGLNRANPAEMIYRNLVMSANVIDACFEAGVAKLIALGSVCAYPADPPHIPFVEADLWEGFPEVTNSPYGVAKRAAGCMLQAYHTQYNLASVHLVPTNMYGPYDDFSLGGSHVIPAMIRKFLNAVDTGADKVALWGTGTATRDFLHVSDCCTAIIAAITDNSLVSPEPINLGSGRECSMVELAGMIARLTGFGGKIVWDSSEPDGQRRRCLDTARASRLLGFTSNIDLESGLKSTIEWYRGRR